MNVAEGQKGGPNIVRRKKKERRKGWRIERKTNAQVEKEKRTEEKEEVKKNLGRVRRGR